MGMVQSLWLHDVKIMKRLSLCITSERQDHAAAGEASVDAEIQPSPKNMQPPHLLLETADLLAENTNQVGQAAGDGAELRNELSRSTH